MVHASEQLTDGCMANTWQLKSQKTSVSSLHVSIGSTACGSGQCRHHLLRTLMANKLANLAGPAPSEVTITHIRILVHHAEH